MRRLLHKERAAALAAKAAFLCSIAACVRYQYTAEPLQGAPSASCPLKKDSEELKAFCTKHGEGEFLVRNASIRAYAACGKNAVDSTNDASVAKNLYSAEDAAPFMGFCEKREAGKYTIFGKEKLGIVTCLGKTGQGESAAPPKSIKLSEIGEFVEGKKIVLFGENHGLKYDDLHFAVDIIPRLKEKGFTHLAIEMDSETQKFIDAFSKKKDQKSLDRLYSNLKDRINIQGSVDSFLFILISAISEGMDIVCFDVEEDLAKRDRAMKERIAEVVDKGGRIAVFVGGAHVSNLSEGYYLHENSMVQMPRAGAQVREGKVVVEWQKITFKPLGRLLIEAYGAENVGLVGLVIGDCQNVDACMDYPWVAGLAYPTELPPEMRSHRTIF